MTLGCATLLLEQEMENGYPPKRRKGAKNQVKVEIRLGHIYFYCRRTLLVQLPSTWSNRPFFFSWQSNDSKDTGKRVSMVSSFIPWAQCAIYFRSLPLTRGVLLLLCSLSLLLSRLCVCVYMYVCASIFLFFLSSQPV